MGKFVYMWHSCIWWKELPHPNPKRDNCLPVAKRDEEILEQVESISYMIYESVERCDSQ